MNKFSIIFLMVIIYGSYTMSLRFVINHILLLFFNVNRVRCFTIRLMPNRIRDSILCSYFSRILWQLPSTILRHHFHFHQYLHKFFLWKERDQFQLQSISLSLSFTSIEKTYFIHLNRSFPLNLFCKWIQIWKKNRFILRKYHYYTFSFTGFKQISHI
jgi:hypothetical protein